MGKRAVFTEAQIARAVKAARAIDPKAIVEVVTDQGTIRIVPEGASSIKSAKQERIDRFFNED